MGLIKAIGGAVSGTLGDQWKEYFYCDSIDKNVLAVKGQKRTSRRSSNTSPASLFSILRRSPAFSPAPSARAF